MDLNNKLKGIPTIYYVNLDNRVDRREYMESQFNHWGIENYVRVSGTKYLASKYDEWKHLISNQKVYYIHPQFAANFITHIEMIKNWLETTDDEYMIMMEDDYDLSLIEYWNFDWKYLMDHIPYDWDCIQLGFESFKEISFFLHPKFYYHYFGACMINRYYAQKLINLYLKDNKIVVDREINNVVTLNNNLASGTTDYSICQNGKTYCIPLIPQNPYLTSHENYDTKEDDAIAHFYIVYELYHNWWKNEHHKFSLEDFFTYGKPNDYEMTKKIDLRNYHQYQKRIVYK